MKKIIFLFLAILAVTITVSAQVSQQWSQNYSNTQLPLASHYSNSIATDISGNVYVGGKSDSLPTSSDYLLIKYNASGARQWVRRYNGAYNGYDEAISVKVDASGNIYLAGTSQGSDTTTDFATVKYNSSGVLQWATRYTNTTPGSVSLTDFELDNSGNTYLSGALYRTATNSSDIITIKYNSSGVQQWVVFYNGGFDDYLPEIKVAASGNVYLAATSDTTSFNQNYRVIKYNSSGVQQWTKSYNGTLNDNDSPVGLDIDATENVYILGNSNGFSNSDMVTLKYNTSGTLQWTKVYNDSIEFATDISVSSGGNIFITGHRYSAGIPYSKFVTIKYNAAGTQLWVSSYFGYESNNPFDLIIDGSENVYISGQVSTSGQEMLTLKYNTSGIQQWLITYIYTGASSNSAVELTLDNSGNVCVAGNSFDFNTLTGVVSTVKYIQSSSSLVLTLNAFIEGFYNSSSNSTVTDSIKVILRNNSSPYNRVDSSKAVINTTGTAVYNFSTAVNNTPYYIVLRHRNSIETWSNSGNSFLYSNLNYNFAESAGQAFGSNQKHVDTFPSRYAIYSGDVNQDGVVDATDAGAIDNDAYNFTTGYVNSDLTGDEVVDASDAAIADNNAFNFVSKITP